MLSNALDQRKIGFYRKRIVNWIWQCKVISDTDKSSFME